LVALRSMSTYYENLAIKPATFYFRGDDRDR